MVVDEVNKSIKERLRLVKVVGRYMLSVMEQEKHKIDREGVHPLVLCCGTLGIAPPRCLFPGYAMWALAQVMNAHGPH